MNGKFVAVGNVYESYSTNKDAFVASSDDGLVVESSDGAFWNLRPDSMMDFVCVSHLGGKWVAAREGGGIFTSGDLETWVLQSEQAGPFLTKTSTSLVASNGNRFWVSPLSSPGTPDVIDQPEGTVVLPGSTVTLSVVAEGDATLSYQWYQGESGAGI